MIKIISSVLILNAEKDEPFLITSTDCTSWYHSNFTSDSCADVFTWINNINVSTKFYDFLCKNLKAQMKVKKNLHNTILEMWLITLCKKSSRRPILYINRTFLNQNFLWSYIQVCYCFQHNSVYSLSKMFLCIIKPIWLAM